MFDSIPGFLLVILGICLVAMPVLAVTIWCLTPPNEREPFVSLLRHVTVQRRTLRSDPPIYAVHVDGQLLYASGKEDVEDFLFAATVIASRQMLRLVQTAQPATFVLTCGDQTIVIEISNPNS